MTNSKPPPLTFLVPDVTPGKPPIETPYGLDLSGYLGPIEAAAIEAQINRNVEERDRVTVTAAHREGDTLHVSVLLPAYIDRIETTIGVTPEGASFVFHDETEPVKP